MSWLIAAYASVLIAVVGYMRFLKPKLRDALAELERLKRQS